MSTVLFAALSGAFFGLLAVGVQFGLRRSAEPQLGAVVVAPMAAVIATVISLPSIALDTIHVGDLWPFFVAGLFVPGVSQIFFTTAVRDAGPSRAAILIGTAPLMSVGIALTLLGEPLKPLLVVGTILVVAGGIVLASERARPAHFRVLGAVFALACAALFAGRDNAVRWAARGAHPPPLAAVDVSLAGAAIVVLAYGFVMRGPRLWAGFARALPAFVPAGAALALGYAFLFAAFDRGRVEIVAPLNATQSLWAVAASVLLFGRAAELIGRRVVLAGLLVVAGAAVIGVVR